MPSDYKNCKRLEKGVEVSFDDSYAAETQRYDKLKPQLKGQSHGEITEGEVNFNRNLVISECHTDLYPKERLMSSLSGFGKDTALILERLPSSQNTLVKEWLEDGAASELPPTLRAYCDLVDQDNFKGASNASDEYRVKIASATKDILLEAKKEGVQVLFLESEHTYFDTKRHEHLITALTDLKTANPDKSFVVLCGTDHDNALKKDVLFSDVIGASSCSMLERKEQQHASDHKELGEQLAKSGVTMKTVPHHQQPTVSSILKEKGGSIDKAMEHDPKFNRDGGNDGFSR